jgi:hypothetical protein
MTANYVISYKELSGLNALEISKKLKSMSGIKVKDILISHLIFYNTQPIYTGNGVYLFKYNDVFVYVGSCVSRNFVDRIPVHFDLRTNGWLNSLLCRIISKEGKDKSTETLTAAATWAMNNCHLVLINFESEYYKRHHIKGLEDVLRHELKPYNFKKRKTYEDAHCLSDHFSTLIEPVKKKKRNR